MPRVDLDLHKSPLILNQTLQAIYRSIPVWKKTTPSIPNMLEAKISKSSLSKFPKKSRKATVKQANSALAFACTRTHAIYFMRSLPSDTSSQDTHHFFGLNGSRVIWLFSFTTTASSGSMFFHSPHISRLLIDSQSYSFSGVPTIKSTQLQADHLTAKFDTGTTRDSFWHGSHLTFVRDDKNGVYTYSKSNCLKAAHILSQKLFESARKGILKKGDASSRPLFLLSLSRKKIIEMHRQQQKLVIGFTPFGDNPIALNMSQLNHTTHTLGTHKRNQSYFFDLKKNTKHENQIFDICFDIAKKIPEPTTAPYTFSFIDPDALKPTKRKGHESEQKKLGTYRDPAEEKMFRVITRFTIDDPYIPDSHKVTVRCSSGAILASILNFGKTGAVIPSLPSVVFMTSPGQPFLTI